jgi:hydrogenase expression/formation protein HypE
LPPLKVGKVPNDVLQKIVFENLGHADPSVLLGPNLGEDAALIQHGGEVIAFKSDPITGSADEVGWLAVYVNANDIATRGAKPRWFIQCILLPEGSSSSDLNEICRQIDSAAKEIGVSIVGGHTEVTRGIDRPIVVGAMIGTVSDMRFFTSGGASPGDALYMTKSAGLEGTAILSSEPRIASKFGKAFTTKCKALVKLINVAGECAVLAKQDGVTAMHDITEGGLLGGVWELAEAAHAGIFIDLARVPVLEETVKICSELGLDPYRLIGSGSLLFTVRPSGERDVEATLKSSGIGFSKIGAMKPASDGRSFKGTQGKVHAIEPPASDELWKGLA